MFWCRIEIVAIGAERRDDEDVDNSEEGGRWEDPHETATKMGGEDVGAPVILGLAFMEVDTESVGGRMAGDADAAD